MKRIIPFVICVILFLYFNTDLFSENKSGLSKENQMKLLTLREAKIALQTAQDNYDRYLKEWEDVKRIYSKDAVTGKEVSEAEAKLKEAQRRLELAKVSLLKVGLSFLDDATHISVVSAKKYIDTTGNRIITVTIKNTSNISSALLGEAKEVLSNLGIFEKSIYDLLTVEDIYVSVKKSGVVIGYPIEAKISELPPGKQTTISFRLNQDADDVSLSLQYQKKEDVRDIYLEKQSSEDIVRVSSLKFAQEGQLGSTVSYDLSLERLAENEKTFALGVFNLPESIKYRFTEEGNQLSEVKFSKGNSRRNLVLKVFIPDKLPDAELDRDIDFFAVVADTSIMDNLTKLAISRGDKKITTDDLNNFKVGYERLKVTPRGTGEMEISLSNLYYEIKVGEKINLKLTVKNTGSVNLSGIHFSVDAPFEWEFSLNPETISEIGAKKEETVQMSISPPQNIDVGGYEIKIKAECEYQGTLIQTDEKVVRVQVTAKTSLFLNVVLIVGVVALVVGIAVFTIRLSRR